MENNKTYKYNQIDKKIDRIINEVSKYMKSIDKKVINDKIKKAYLYSREAHEWDFRHSWEPYINHPVEATIILLNLKPDLECIQACLLHDVIEDTIKTKEDIKQEFSEEVANICEWMEKLSKVKYRWEERTIWSLRKMFVAMADDLRVIFVKLSDRLHNMKTLKYHPKEEKRKRIALETLNIYAPIADRLWLYKIKNSLEEECFKILEPLEYKKVKNELAKLKDTREYFQKNAKIEICELLKNTDLKYKVNFRVKSIYSIYKKLKKKWVNDISDLYDIFGIRIVLDDISSCYRVLWLIHNKWIPIPKKFKDYIALPKPNWYRSLHTTVIWLLRQYRQQATEIQIKTQQMHNKAEIWVAAHFEYKEKWSKISTDIDWVSDLKKLTENLWNNELMDSLKIDVFKDRIFVLTPKWDTKNLPVWSTPIDFAYEIHSDLGNHIMLAKVNGKVYPLDKELSNWDIVEVIIDKSKKPNPFCLSFLKTTKAKNKIKEYLKRENKDLHIDRWKEILNKYLEKIWWDKLDKDLTILKNIDWRINNTMERESILEQIWNFSRTPSALIKKIIKNIPKEKLNKEIKTKKIENISKEIKEKDVWIIIWWDKDIQYKKCNICKASFPDKIISHINNKSTVTIHKRDCYSIKNANKDRFISAYWQWEEENDIKVSIELLVKDKIWVLKKLSDILYSMQVDIYEIFSKRIKKNEILLWISLKLPEYDYLMIDRILDRIKIDMWDLLLDYDIKSIKI